MSTDLQQQAFSSLIEGNYEQATRLYEQAIELEPQQKSHIWYLGLALLLQGQETEAQTTWWLGMSEGEPDEVEQWTIELLQILHTETERREELADNSTAWAIRQHVREIAPQDVNNLLRSAELSVKLDTFSGEALQESGLIELLQQQETPVDADLLLQVVKVLLEYAPLDSAVADLAEACANHAHQPVEFVDSILRAAIEAAYAHRRSTVAVRLAEICLSFDVVKIEVLRHLSGFYKDAEQYTKAIETAHQCYEMAETLHDQSYANHILLGCLLGASGYWDETCLRMDHHRTLLRSLIEAAPTHLDSVTTFRLFISSFFLPYVDDDPLTSRTIQNQVSQLCQINMRQQAGEAFEKIHKSITQRKVTHSTQKATRKLRIGYLSHCLSRHSVGWLSRWLFQHHDRERFEIYAYMMNQVPISEFSQQWFANHSDRAYALKVFDNSLLDLIHNDEIDILIDLDSLTLDSICEILAVKPAPIQATWLGWDATGLPAVDYFIADPYVLPDSAQDYYTEKIWRLPQTYIAVDGFEVGVPTLRRDQLGIPNDAITYLVVQRGYKRHPDNVRLQIRILREVPNSYLLVKGIADEKSSQRFYQQLAEEEGVAGDRIRFLPWSSDEPTHRANMGIADVVLDTYPYNGATTTLETLWMGIPMVTRVGQQFAARNSYTMMVNAGIDEGIAWTDDEYVEWGIRLGKDEALRQQISWKLRQSRQTAPLWNAKQFTREMENAYEHMWNIYVS